MVETWLTEGNTKACQNSLVDYVCYSNYRTFMTRGGVSVYVRNFLCKYVKTVITKYIDCVFLVLDKRNILHK